MRRHAEFADLFPPGPVRRRRAVRAAEAGFFCGVEDFLLPLPLVAILLLLLNASLLPPPAALPVPPGS
jgi:hypothetical protein